MVVISWAMRFIWDWLIVWITWRFGWIVWITWRSVKNRFKFLVSVKAAISGRWRRRWLEVVGWKLEVGAEVGGGAFRVEVERQEVGRRLCVVHAFSLLFWIPSFCCFYFFKWARTRGRFLLGQRHVPLAPKRHWSAPQKDGGAKSLKKKEGVQNCTISKR